MFSGYSGVGERSWHAMFKSLPIFPRVDSVAENSMSCKKCPTPLSQLAGAKMGWVAADDLEFGQDRKVPLWIFGFLW